MTNRDRRDERGATAVLVAVLAVAMIGIAGIVVDIGHAWAKRALSQTNVDLAVTAAAAELTQEAGCNEAAIAKAEEFLQRPDNAVPGQNSVALTDGNPVTGSINCPGGWRIELQAPTTRINYGLAQVFRQGDSADVTAQATVVVSSAPGDVLPFYLREPAECGWGEQTLKAGSTSDEGCGLSTGGSFGFLGSPRDGQVSGNKTVKENLLHGIDHPLARYSGEPVPSTCGSSDPAVRDEGELDEPANCVARESGNKASGLTDGLIDGRLATATTELCASEGPLVGDTGWDHDTINRDTLECFLTDPSQSVEDITSADYDGNAVLDEAIFDSPRFMWVPVLAGTHALENNTFYPIVGFRPAFITRFAGKNKGHLEMKAMAINPLALPRSSSGDVFMPDKKAINLVK